MPQRKPSPSGRIHRPVVSNTSAWTSSVCSRSLYTGSGVPMRQIQIVPSTSPLASVAHVPAGVSRDDPAVQKAIVYVGRCQNLKSEYNPLPFAAKATDEDKGGFVYTPSEAEGKGGKGGKGGGRNTPQGGLRSYGSMS